MSADVRDILDLEGPSTELTKESVLHNRRKNEKYINISILLRIFATNSIRIPNPLAWTE